MSRTGGLRAAWSGILAGSAGRRCIAMVNSYRANYAGKEMVIGASEGTEVKALPTVG